MEPDYHLQPPLVPDLTALSESEASLRTLRLPIFRSKPARTCSVCASGGENGTSVPP